MIVDNQRNPKHIGYSPFTIQGLPISKPQFTLTQTATTIHLYRGMTVGSIIITGYFNAGVGAKSASGTGQLVLNITYDTTKDVGNIVATGTVSADPGTYVWSDTVTAPNGSASYVLTAIVHTPLITE